MASESHGYKTAICQATGEGKGGERYDSVGLGIKLRNSTQQFLHCLSSKQSQFSTNNKRSCKHSCRLKSDVLPYSGCYSLLRSTRLPMPTRGSGSSLETGRRSPSYCIQYLLVDKNVTPHWSVSPHSSCTMACFSQDYL